MTDFKIEQQFRCIKCNVELTEDHEGNLVHPKPLARMEINDISPLKKLISLTEAS